MLPPLPWMVSLRPDLTRGGGSDADGAFSLGFDRCSVGVDRFSIGFDRFSIGFL